MTLAALAGGLVACGGGDEPEPVSVALAPAYSAVAVVKVLPDGISVSRLETFELRLFDLQTAGGRVVGRVARSDRGPAYEVEGTFEADTGRFRFEPFEAALTSTASERVDALGGRGDDALGGDGIANAVTGFVQTSSGATYQTTGSVLGVSEADDRPVLDPSKVRAVASDLGRFVLEAEPGFVEGPYGVEVFTFSPFEEQADFRVVRANDAGAVALRTLEGLPGDVLVLRAVRAGRLGPAITVRITE